MSTPNPQRVAVRFARQKHAGQVKTPSGAEEDKSDDDMKEKPRPNDHRHRIILHQVFAESIHAGEQGAGDDNQQNPFPNITGFIDSRRPDWVQAVKHAVDMIVGSTGMSGSKPMPSSTSRRMSTPGAT